MAVKFVGQGHELSDIRELLFLMLHAQLTFSHTPEFQPVRDRLDRFIAERMVDDDGA